MKNLSLDLFATVETLLSGKELVSCNLDELHNKASVVSASAGKLLTVLRLNKHDDIEESKSESFSPEVSN